MAEVEVQSEDGLRRRVWSFTHSGGFLMLVRFANEERATTRHKFRAVTKWESSDERSYHSQLKRPEAIPAWVVDEALKQIPPPVVTIGWTRDKDRAAITQEPKECG
jgi:hypothetical protein